MPARQPFTQLCRLLAQPRSQGRVDLHIHTTCSDGTYTPAQIVELARRSGLAAVAITDHDTLAGVTMAQAAARGGPVEVVPGIEVSAEREGQEFHLLGYFIDLGDRQLQTTLTHMQERRVERFREMVERLRGFGIDFDAAALAGLEEQSAPGRRHLAELLVRSKKAGSVREAFQRFLGDRSRFVAPKKRLPVTDAIALVRGAGGVAAWAHPPYDATKGQLRELRDLGLQAVEVEYPRCRLSFGATLRAWAKELGLAVTGGSDCHGPDAPVRGLGAFGITSHELAALRARVVG